MNQFRSAFGLDGYTLEEDLRILNVIDPTLVVHLTEPPILSNRINLKLLEIAIGQQLPYKTYYEQVNIYEINRDALPFSILCKQCNLPESFMHKYHKYLDWFAVCKYQRVSMSFIDMYAEKMYWESVFEYQKVPEYWLGVNEEISLKYLGLIFEHQSVSKAYIEKNGRAFWTTIAHYQKLSLEDMDAWWHAWPPEVRKVACRYQHVTESFLQRVGGVDYISLSSNQLAELSVPFLEEHYEKLDVKSVCATHYLTEAFVEAHEDDIDFYALSWNKLDMSRPFMEKYAKRLCWMALTLQYEFGQGEIQRWMDAPEFKDHHNYMPMKSILEAQRVSPSFIEAFVFGRDDATAMLVIAAQYQVLPEEWIEEHIDRLDWGVISLYQKISRAFIERHMDEVVWYNLSQIRALELGEAFMETHADRLYFDQVNSLKAAQYVRWKSAPTEMEDILREMNNGVKFVTQSDADDGETTESSDEE